MRTQNTFIAIFVIVAVVFTSAQSVAQNKAYQRKKPAATTAQPATKAAEVADSSAAAAPDSEKLDIQQLEQKYWTSKDTDFSVVQNRTYTKAKRTAVSLTTGPIVNDPFNSGLTYGVSMNYYFDERYGVELMYQLSDLEDSDATQKFRGLSGGGVRPDFNRDTGFYGLGFNWVPFYAKMSFLGKKIIYFDMQVTPFVGVAQYDQLSETKTSSDSSFAYGFDVTQYFFFSSHVAARINLHNRFYSADVLNYSTGRVARPDDATNTTIFLLGLTFFY